MTIYKGTVTASPHLNIRSTAGVTATNDIGDLDYGDLVEASAIASGWWQLTSRNGLPQTGYAFANGGIYIRLDSTVEGPPPPTDEPAGWDGKWTARDTGEVTYFKKM